MKPSPRPRNQQGQALTEFLVLAMVLLPLYLLVPMLAKYADIASQADMASRYVAFEAMTRNDTQNSWKPPEQLAGEVRRRFLGNSDAPIKTGDVAGNFLAHQNLFWRGPGGTALIANFDTDVGVSFGPDHNPAHSDAFSAASDGAPFNGVAGSSTDHRAAAALGLSDRGIYRGNVTVRLANVPEGLKSYEPFDKINLAVTRHTSLLIDGWQAKSPAQVLSRIDNKKLVPATALRDIAKIVDASVTLAEGGQLRGPKLGQLDFWSDVVPANRLK